MKQDAKAVRTRQQADRLRPVAGRHNQRLKELRLAFRRAELTAQGECAIEGVKLLEEALRSGQHLNSVFFSQSARPLAEKLLPQINSRTETLVLPDALFNSIVPSDAPQGVAALLKLPAFSSAQMLDRRSGGPSQQGAAIQRRVVLPDFSRHRSLLPSIGTEPPSAQRGDAAARHIPHDDQ